jgi:hypothetical protein
MNLACAGIPEAWKTAIIIPLHKAKDKTSVDNYRPISNLVSISKIFEKIILMKLDAEHPGIEGQHQHGFRRQRGTHTALLELQSVMANYQDNNKHASIYSLDMSAAFDLLRPSVFHMESSHINPGLLNIIIDFLSNRKIAIKVGNHVSGTENLNVGCVQGSALGPKLFNIYCASVATRLPNTSKIISYADDSYVINASDNLEALKIDTEACFEAHDTFLRGIGMVVNATKTELLLSTRQKPNPSFSISAGEHTVKASDSIKALGVIVRSDLAWTDHVNHALNRSRHVVYRIKHLRKWLTKDELLRLVTTQYFSILYYACPLWIGSLDSKCWRRLNSAHYRVIRAALGIFRSDMSRSELDKLSKRATPLEWSKYSITSTVIKLFNNSDTNIAILLRDSVYVNDRKPKKGKFLDKSRLKVGKQSLPYRIGPIFANLSFDWIDFHLSDDTLRRLLKQEFFTYYELKPPFDIH